MKRTKHGFTLVELIIVIAVIGVLAAILIPTFSNVIDKANAKSALSDARNTVTQYLTDSFDKGLPENLVVVVKKANNYYLYGYNTTGEGSIQVSSGNPYRGLDSVQDLINGYSWNAKKGEEAPENNVEYTDVKTNGTFYLVPYTGSTPNVAIKGFHAGKADVDMSKYPNLKARMTEDMGDNTDVFHGILLPGQFTLDTGANGSGTGHTDPSDPTDPVQQYTVRFMNSPADGGEVHKTETVDYGQDATPPADPTRTGYNFTGWNGSYTNVKADTVVYAEWEEDNTIPADAKYYYGGAYREADGNLNWAETVPNGGTPCNILEEDLTMSTTLANNTVVNRTFTATTNVTVTNGVTYVQATETTDWSAVSGVTFVEKTAGATVSGSIALSSMNGKTSASIIGSPSKRINYVLIEDINWNSSSWNAPGYTSYFYSHFDGMGYSVNAIKVANSQAGTSASYVSVGFLGKLYGGNGTYVQVNDLYLPNANVTMTSGSYASAGIVAGLGYYAKITNCHTSGYVKNSKCAWGCGGIIGYTHLVSTARGNVQVSKCSSTASVENSSSHTGGIIGMSIGSGVTVSESWYSGKINSTGSSVGGIDGGDKSVTTISNCWSQGLITCGGTAGGIASTAANITNCHSTCNIKSTGNIIGGIVGTSNGIIKNCWYDGYIYSSATSSTGANIAGIAGKGSTSTKITDCWAAGSYFGSGASGKGLAGIYADSVGVSNSSGSYIVDRCISYAKLYNSQSNTYVYPISYVSHAGTSGGNATASYFVNGSCFKGCRASVSADGSFTVTSKTVIAETLLYCTEWSAAYAYRGVDSATDIKNAIQEEYTGAKTGAGPWAPSSYSSSGAWDISGTYPVLRSNPGSPS